MSYQLVFIDDKIREERIGLRINVDRSVDAVVEWYIDEYGLPRYYFDLSRIEYRLVRPADETQLSGRTTFRQAGIAEGETLQLVSPEGRRVWRVVQRLLDEIESQIKDQVTGDIKDRVVEEVWDRVTDKLAEIEKTHTGGHRVEQVRGWVDQIGGPTKLVNIGEKISKAAEADAISPARGVLATVGKAGLTALTIGGGIAVSLALVAVGARMLKVFPESLEDPEELVAKA